ncbi:hypothetical protein Leryth_005912 [Lithospermum erythrorhizon]|nr:hypothetical protein Leryth_005912 [Lithospermum erythrorhizon]
MGSDENKAASSSSSSTRLKREECKRTKHDSAFSLWKILVGPSDWDEHVLGKEGVERYRTQNLPNRTSCPGVYELGVAISHSWSARRARRLDSDFVVPVYLGQADNVRNRLQQYGREGSHLEKVPVSTTVTECNYELVAEKGPGLFRDIFSRGLPIAYRWAPMQNKRLAEETEAQLLKKFDYAWNKDINGQRRHRDILKKLDSLSKASQLNQILKKLQFFPQKKLGIKIKACERVAPESGRSIVDGLETKGIFSRVFKFGRSRPRSVSLNFGIDDDTAGVCGVALGHGLICNKPPVEGRKRCIDHKGMKVNGFKKKYPKDSQAMHIRTSIDDIKNELQSGGSQETRSACILNNDLSRICGYILESDSPCTETPVQGNKRCLQHKGKRIQKSAPKSVMKAKTSYLDPPVHNYDDRDCKFPDKFFREQNQPFPNTENNGNDYKMICGVYLEDGTSCSMNPVRGRKRCEEHKGMRIKATNF